MSDQTLSYGCAISIESAEHPNYKAALRMADEVNELIRPDLFNSQAIASICLNTMQYRPLGLSDAQVIWFG